MREYALSPYDAGVLTGTHEMAAYYEAAVKSSQADPKLVANWVTVELSAFLNRDNRGINDAPVSASGLAQLLRRIGDNTVSGKIAKEVFEAMWNGEGDADSVIEKKGLKQITDSSTIENAIDEILAGNPKQVEQYKSGQEKLFGFFVGQVMKATQGKANPAQVNVLLKKKLHS